MLFSMYYEQVVNGKRYLEVLVVHQVLYMIDSKNGGKKVYSNACGSMDYRYMIEIAE